MPRLRAVLARPVKRRAGLTRCIGSIYEYCGEAATGHAQIKRAHVRLLPERCLNGRGRIRRPRANLKARIAVERPSNVLTCRRMVVGENDGE